MTHQPPSLGFVLPQRLSGAESVVGPDGKPVSSLLDYWTWSASDLLGNVQRGVLAEYLVSLALGGAASVRTPWDSFDARSAAGLTVEVKSASYIQQWSQRDYSPIKFPIRETTAWDPHTGKSIGDPCRQAQVYVFALLAHKDKATVNPLDTRQWTYFVLATSALNAHCQQQRSVGLTRLRDLGAREASWKDLAQAVEESLNAVHEPAKEP